MSAPVLVVEVEVGESLPDLSPGRPDGESYQAAQVIVRRGGVPVGQRRVPLGDEVLDGEDLAAHLDGLWHDGPAEPPPRPPENAPFVSVVVPSAMERPEQLVRCVTRVAEIDYPKFEVIVVDNRPVGTPERARLHADLAAHPRVRVVVEPLVGSSAARNRGIDSARGDVIAFTDDDITVDPNWLNAIANRFATDPRTDCVTGRVFPAELETPAQVWFENSGATISGKFTVVNYDRDASDPYTARVRTTDRPQPESGDRVPIFRGVFGGSGNLAVRAEVLAELGGFHPALGAGTIAHGGEDVEFLSRLLRHGHRVTMDPAVAVFHHHRRDYPGLRRQMFGYGTGYTAALTAMITADFHHMAGLVRLAGAFTRIARRRKQARTPVQYPSRLRWTERWGLVCGPVAYLRSRLVVARWRSRHRKAGDTSS